MQEGSVLFHKKILKTCQQQNVTFKNIVTLLHRICIFMTWFIFGFTRLCKIFLVDILHFAIKHNKNVPQHGN